MKLIRPALLIFAGAAALLAAGCSETMLVSVDGYSVADTKAPGKYFLASGTPGLAESDLQFQTFAKDLEKALGSRGWSRVAERKDAAVLIKFRYGVSEPTTTVHQDTFPEYGIVGYRYSGGANGATLAAPIYGQTGVSTNDYTRQSFTMRIIIEAHDLTAAGEPQLWKTIVTASDGVGDLRSVLGQLLAAASPNIGRDTHGVVSTEIKPDRKR